MNFCLKYLNLTCLLLLVLLLTNNATKESAASEILLSKVVSGAKKVATRSLSSLGSTNLSTISTSNLSRINYRSYGSSPNAKRNLRITAAVRPLTAYSILAGASVYTDAFLSLNASYMMVPFLISGSFLVGLYAPCKYFSDIDNPEKIAEAGLNALKTIFNSQPYKLLIKYDQDSSKLNQHISEVYGNKADPKFIREELLTFMKNADILLSLKDKIIKRSYEGKTFVSEEEKTLATRKALSELDRNVARFIIMANKLEELLAALDNLITAIY